MFKEFLDKALTEGFALNNALFAATASNELYPNPHARRVYNSEAEMLSNYRFLGRLVGKAIYEGVVVNIPFAPFFLNNVLGVGNTLDDLRTLDPQQLQSLKRLKEMADVSEACLYFSIEEEFVGETTETELIPGGKDILVTNDNVVRYLHAIGHYRLTTTTKDATDAFVAGLSDVVDPHWLRLFNSAELQQLISGGKGRLDVNDLKAHVKLVGGYKTSSRTIELLWDVLDELSDDDQSRFMQFCTGSSRPPLLGFGSMNPPFSIRRAEEGSNLNYFVDVDRLPSASTCFNLLKLPPYKTKANLKAKLLAAIRSGAGFDLT